jgi:fructose-bisphosphate aldolase class II
MTAALIADAVQIGRPVSAFDVITLEHAEAIVQAAEKTSQPVILQVSRSTVSYHGSALRPLAVALRAIASAATVPVSLHLDSVDSGDLMRYGAALGFSSVGLDVGSLPYEERIAKVSRAARWLSANYVFVEAGLGPVRDWHTISPNGDGSNATAQLAADFVARTNIDALNVSLINTAERTFDVAPCVSVIHRLREHVRVPLVVQLDSPVTNRDLQRSIRAGIVKVHVGSALDITFSSALRHRLGSDTTGDPRSYLAEVRTALTETVSVIIGTITGDDPSHTP